MSVLEKSPAGKLVFILSSNNREKIRLNKFIDTNLSGLKNILIFFWQRPFSRIEYQQLGNLFSRYF